MSPRIELTFFIFCKHILRGDDGSAVSMSHPVDQVLVVLILPWFLEPLDKSRIAWPQLSISAQAITDQCAIDRKHRPPWNGQVGTKTGPNHDAFAYSRGAEGTISQTHPSTDKRPQRGFFL